MTIFILNCENPNIRGLLQKWLIEPKPNVFVGKITKTLRDKLWEIIQCECKNGATCIFQTNNEQGFDTYLYGKTNKEIIDFDGIKLVSNNIETTN